MSDDYTYTNVKDDDEPPAKESSKHSRRPDLCLPPEGKTYLTIGQDLYSIQEYIQEQQNASLHWYMKRHERRQAHRGTTVSSSSSDKYKYELPVPRADEAVPAAVMVYTDIQTLRGLEHPVDYGTGIEYADGALTMVASPPNNPLGVGLQIGLWLNGTQGCQDIVDGKLDSQVKQLMRYLGDSCPASKIFLRIGYEFDNPDFGYASDPPLYRQAFRYIVHQCRKRRSCKRRTEMVWHSWAAGLPSSANNTQLTLDDFYPGNDSVDWIGISVFQQFFSNNAGGTLQDIHDVLGFAAAHDKPTMIAESTPFGGIHNNPHLSDDTTTTNNIWDAWFDPTLDLISQYDIGMWSYINCNWQAQPMWHNVGFGDTRLSIDQDIMDQWHDHVLASRRFVRATDYELCGNYPDDYYNDYEFDYVKEYDRDHHYRSKSMAYNDDDIIDRHRRSRYHDPQYPYRKYDYDYRYSRDDNKMDKRGDDDNKTTKKEDKWMWGNERSERREGLWNAVLPIVMLSSSLAIIFFMYNATRRRSSRLERTPRAQRVRFAHLDDKEDPDDGSFALYGSIHNSDFLTPKRRNSEKDSLRWKEVRRVGPHLIVSNTQEGTTIVA